MVATEFLLFIWRPNLTEGDITIENSPFSDWNLVSQVDFENRDLIEKSFCIFGDPISSLD